MTGRYDANALIRTRCMSDDDWAGWCARNDDITPIWLRADTPCRDCIASYCSEMRQAGLCDFEPMSVGRRLLLSTDAMVSRRREQWRRSGAKKRAARRAVATCE